MKLPLHLLPALALCGAAASHAQTGAPTTAASQARAGYGVQHLPSRILAADRDATTDDQLRAMQKSGKFNGLQKDKSRERSTFSLDELSDYLQIGTRYTLVPKGAILHIPPRLAAVVVKEPKGVYVSWQEMQAANRGSLANFEVTIDQATGKTPIPDAKLDYAKRAGNLVVATHQGGAISVARTTTPAAP